MGMIGYFAEIDSEKINQLLESTEKPLMDNIHDTLSGLRRLDIDKRWDFLHFGLTGTSAFDPAKNDPLSRAVLGEHSLEDGIDGFLGLTWNQELAATDWNHWIEVSCVNSFPLSDSMKWRFIRE